jgi:hypothetical protein
MQTRKAIIAGTLAVAFLATSLTSASARGFHHHGSGRGFGLVGALFAGAATIVTAPLAIIAEAGRGSRSDYDGPDYDNGPPPRDYPARPRSSYYGPPPGNYPPQSGYYGPPQGNYPPPPQSSYYGPPQGAPPPGYNGPPSGAYPAPPPPDYRRSYDGYYGPPPGYDNR